MIKTISLISTFCFVANPLCSLADLLSLKSQNEISDSHSYSVNTNDKPGQTDIGWNTFLNNSAPSHYSDGNYNQDILNNQDLIKGQNYHYPLTEDPSPWPREFQPKWTIGGGLFLNRDNETYTNTPPAVNAEKGLFGSFNYINSTPGDQASSHSYINKIRNYQHKKINEGFPLPPGYSDLDSYNLNNFSYANYYSKTAFQQSSELDLTPTFIGPDDYGYQQAKGITRSHSKILIKQILNDFLHIWYFDNWVKLYKASFTNDQYYQLSMYYKLFNDLYNDRTQFGWLNELYFNLSIRYNYVINQTKEQTYNIPEGASALTNFLGGLMDTALATTLDAVPGLGWIASTVIDLFLLNMQGQYTNRPEEKTNNIQYFSGYLTYAYMVYIFNDLLGTPQEFQKGDYSKPIANFVHQYGHFPSIINLRDFNVFLNLRNFFKDVHSYYKFYFTSNGEAHPDTHYEQTFIDSFDPQSLVPYLNLKVQLKRPNGDITKIFDHLNDIYNNDPKQVLFDTWASSTDYNSFLIDLSQDPSYNCPNIINYQKYLTFTGQLPFSPTDPAKTIKILYKKEIIARVRAVFG